MRKIYLLFISASFLLLFGCSESKKTLSDAETAMKTLVSDVAKDPSSVKIDNVNAVYSSDSLCILQFDFTAKNGFGNETTSKAEYIYIVDTTGKYEGLQTLGPDSVFISKPTWEKIKNGKIYENLAYEATIRYLAVTFVNTKGRVVGDKSREKEVDIEVPTKTGKWTLNNYSDSFGEVTEATYLVLTGNGVFSNSATLNSRLTALLFVDNNGFSFRLFEYDSSPVKDDDESYETLIKDSEGVVHKMSLYNSGQSAQLRPYWDEKYSDMVDILNKGGEIIVTMSYDDYGRSDYRFILDVDGFNEAIKYVK